MTIDIANHELKQVKMRAIAVKCSTTVGIETGWDGGFPDQNTLFCLINISFSIRIRRFSGTCPLTK